MALDRFDRNIHYLRVSLTDACNLRCVYCMPEHSTFRSPDELLQDEELLRLIRLFAELGFDKFRLTGGEPTLRKNLPEIVRRTAATPGARDVAMTTNGTRLAPLVPSLFEAGLRRININLNTLNPEKYRIMTRGGNLQDVLDGIDAASKAGMQIKLNVVAVRGYNDGADAADIALLTLEHSWYVRFIELMPIGGITDFQSVNVVPEEELRKVIESTIGKLEPVEGWRPGGKSKLFRLPKAKGMVGFISSISRPFCKACVRARLSADGKLRLCLLQENETDLKTPLRNGASDEALKEIITQSLLSKPESHRLNERQYAKNRFMSEIGG